MSGHSKWSTIKRKKGSTDAKRAKVFTKIAREIMVAARTGSPDPDENAILRMAVAKARQANMPKDNVQRAIDRASATAGGENWEEVRYEAYGPGGVAMLIDAVTDNRNRTVAEIRSALTKAGGTMGETGSVGWVFEHKGVIVVDVLDGVDADAVVLQAIDAGAEDVQVDDDIIEVITEPTSLEAVRQQLEADGVVIGSAEAVMQPTNTVDLNDAKTKTMLKLIDALEDLDDVQRVFSNAEFSDAALVEA